MVADEQAGFSAVCQFDPFVLADFGDLGDNEIASLGGRATLDKPERTGFVNPSGGVSPFGISDAFGIPVFMLQANDIVLHF
jgi:hypothetical protein